MHKRHPMLKRTYTLVMTDDPQLREDLQQSFLELESQVEFVDSSQKLRLKLASTPYDICLIDVDQTDQNPIQTVTFLRKQIAPEMPIIGLSSRNSQGLILQCYAAKINDFYMKPINAEDLFVLLYLWKARKDRNSYVKGGRHEISA